VKEMDKGIIGVLIITIIAIVSITSLSYYVVNQKNETQNSPSPTPTPTSETASKPTPKTYTTPSSSVVAAYLSIEPSGSAATGENYLMISGNVTNTTPNTLYNVGLQVYSFGYPYTALPIEETLINVTIPIASGTYYNEHYTLSQLAPYTSVELTIKIIPDIAYRTPTLYGNDVSVVWTNSP
jgi:hypothetical protein